MVSIPIARSIKPVDAVGFTGLPARNSPLESSILDGVGRESRSYVANWTRRFRTPREKRPSSAGGSPNNSTVRRQREPEH